MTLSGVTSRKDLNIMKIWNIIRFIVIQEKVMVLYINACVRKDSRTDELARELLRHISGSYTERRLADEQLSVLSEERLEYRTKKIEEGDFEDPMFRYAKEFACADTIVISAPYWDLSFPTLLKMYIENIYVTGIVSEYGDDGRPRGLCHAEKLYYVTTAGGPYDPRFSFDYLKEMCTVCFGIKEVCLLTADMLDIVGSDVPKLLSTAKENIKSLI